MNSPPFFSWKGRFYNVFVEKMHPLFDKGFQAESFANLILKPHTKRYTRDWCLYKRDTSYKLIIPQAIVLNPISQDLFWAFGDKAKQKKGGHEILS